MTGKCSIWKWMDKMPAGRFRLQLLKPYSFRTTVYSTLISLSAGQHVLRLVTDSTSQQSRINWFQLVPVGAGGQTPFNSTPFKVSANATSTLQAESN